METRSLFIALIVLTLQLSFTAGQTRECIQSPPGEMITTVPDEYGCAIFDCYNQTVNNTQYDDYEYTGWILNDLRIVNTSYDDGKIIVRTDGESFTIQVNNVSREELGLYHCMLTYKENGEYYLIRFGLNSKGPFFITGWEQYEMNTIVGVSAFGGFLVLTLVIYLLWHYRYQDPFDDTDSIDKYTTTVLPESLPGTGYVAYSDPKMKKIGAEDNWSFGKTDSPKDLRQRYNVNDTAQINGKGPIANNYQSFENKGFEKDDAVHGDDDVFVTNDVVDAAIITERM